MDQYWHQEHLKESLCIHHWASRSLQSRPMTRETQHPLQCELWLKKVKFLLQKKNLNDLNLCRNNAGHDFLTESSRWIWGGRSFQTRHPCQNPGGFKRSDTPKQDLHLATWLVKRIQFTNSLYLLKDILQECQEVLFSSVLPQGLLYSLKDALEHVNKIIIKTLHNCALKFCCAM